MGKGSKIKLIGQPIFKQIKGLLQNIRVQNSYNNNVVRDIVSL